MKILISFISMYLLSGCVNQIPVTISQAPVPNLTLADVISQTAAHTNQTVRWGGSILKVINYPTDTEIEILAKELDSFGEPVAGDVTLGRFLVRAAGFLDPAIYAEKRMLTVFGTVDSVLTRAIGEKPYVYPVVKGQALHLWSRKPENDGQYYPYGYGPPFGGYSPYGGFYPYGYRYGGYGRYW